MNTAGNFDRQRWGRILGQASAVICGSSSLTFAAYVWVSFPNDRSVAWVMVGVLAVSVFAFYAASIRRPILLVVAFAITFFPVGLYLALHPNWVRVAGLAPLGYLAAAILVNPGKRRFLSPRD